MIYKYVFMRLKTLERGGGGDVADITTYEIKNNGKTHTKIYAEDQKNSSVELIYIYRWESENTQLLIYIWTGQ